MSLPDTITENSRLHEMTLLDHLRELRKRLIYSLIAACVGTICAYNYSSEIFDFLTASFYQHFEGALLIGTGPAEAFTLKFKVAFFAGLLLASPIIFFQGWLFIEPGLYPREKKMALPFVLITTLLFLSGVVFCYKAVLPLALSFLHDEYTSIHVTPTIRVTEHLSSLMQALLGFGVVFEMPVLAFFLGRLGIIDHHMMMSGARYAVVLIFVVAALFTPPDVISQLLMAGPLLLLYGISILIVKYTGRTPLPPDPITPSPNIS